MDYQPKKWTHLRWANLDLRRKRKIFNVIREDFKTGGFKVPTFDYFSYEPYGKLMQQFMKHCKVMGLTKKAIMSHWNETTQMKKKDISRVLNGTLKLEAWEMIMIFKAFGLHLKVDFADDDYKRDTRFTSELLSSTMGTKLVIKAHGFIKYALVMDMDDYTKWTITYRKGVVPKSLLKYRAEAVSGLQYYFIKEAKKKTYPFNILLFKAEFDRKWHAGEIKITSE